MQAHQLLTTGQLADLVGVSKDTVLFYDKQQILKPEFRAANGYRYYTLKQADQLSVIVTLKELGMSLEEIHAYLNTRQPATLVQLLQQELTVVADKIQRLTKIQRALTDKLAITQHAQTIEDDESVQVQTRARQALIVTPATTLLDDTTYFSVLKNHYTTLDQQGIGRVMIHGMLMRPETAQQGFETYTYDYIYTRTDDEQQANLILPAGDYLVTHYRGDYHALETAYQRLLTYAQLHHYAVGPYISEAYLLDELAVVDLADYLYELAVPIQP